jgi:hypothetical protein
MVDYVEFPFDLVRQIVLPKKKGDPGPPSEGEPLCFSYGTGAIMAPYENIIAPVPYGPNLAPPFVGFIDQGITPAAKALNNTISLSIWETFISFTTSQLIELSQQRYGNDNSKIMFYQVSMIQTFVTIGYQINMAWYSQYGDPEGLVGLGINGIPAAPPGGGPVPDPGPPLAPTVVMGTMAGGQGSYTYNYQGPITLWVMENRGRGWGGINDFMALLLHGEGDWYTWSIDAICGPSLPGNV